MTSEHQPVSLENTMRWLVRAAHACPDLDVQAMTAEEREKAAETLVFVRRRLKRFAARIRAVDAHAELVRNGQVAGVSPPDLVAVQRQHVAAEQEEAERLIDCQRWHVSCEPEGVASVRYVARLIREEGPHVYVSAWSLEDLVRGVEDFRPTRLVSAVAA
jgi:hypothetical protein